MYILPPPFTRKKSATVHCKWGTFIFGESSVFSCVNNHHFMWPYYLAWCVTMRIFFSASHIFAAEKRTAFRFFFFFLPLTILSGNREIQLHCYSFSYWAKIFYVFHCQKSKSNAPELYKSQTHISISTRVRHYNCKAFNSAPAIKHSKSSRATANAWNWASRLTQNEWSHFPTIRFEISSNWYSIGNMHYGEHNTI